MYSVLVTCPPMINRIENYKELFSKLNLKYFCPKFTQVLTEEELMELLPNYDAWIIGDDPATERVFKAGIKGKLKAVVKWGVGVDNVDFEACKKLNIPVTNTPNVFGEEVSDIAIGYLISLTRQIHNIDKETKKGNWFKPCGTSLYNKKVCLIGFGDIGRKIARKLIPFNMNIFVSDPGFSISNNKIYCNYNDEIKITEELQKVNLNELNDCVENADIIIVACNLNKNTKGLVNKNLILKAKKGVIIINISRGPIVNENDVIELLEEKFIDCVGFDVFEIEPLPLNNKLRNFDKCIFGSHNSSNTKEAVDKTSELALNKLHKFLINKTSKL